MGGKGRVGWEGGRGEEVGEKGRKGEIGREGREGSHITTRWLSRGATTVSAL